MNIGEKVITGEWDGKQIWRPREAREVLLNELEKNISKDDVHDCHASPEDGCKGCALLGNIK